MEIAASFVCVHCFELNDIIVDGTAGRAQTYIEDCQVCCMPNTLVISIDESMRRATIEAEQA